MTFVNRSNCFCHDITKIYMCLHWLVRESTSPKLKLTAISSMKSSLYIPHFCYDPTKNIATMVNSCFLLKENIKKIY